MLPTPFKALEEQLAQLQKQRKANQISKEEFYDRVQALRVTFNGEEWQLGVSGHWKRLVAEEWVAAKPPSQPTEPIPDSVIDEPESPQESPEQALAEPENIIPESASSSFSKTVSTKPPFLSSKLFILVIFGGILLLVGGIAGLLRLAISGNNAPTAIVQIVITPTSTPITSFPTDTVTPTPTPLLTTTPLPVPSYTATLVPETTVTQPVTQDPTFTPFPTDTLTPSPSPTLPPSLSATLSPEPTLTLVLPPVPPSFTLSGLIAYPVFSSTAKTYDIYIRRLETGEIIRVIKNASQPDIHPNGQQIVYRSWPLDRLKLIAENLTDGTGQWFPSNLAEAARPDWSLTGDVVFAANNISPEKWGISFSGGRAGPDNGQMPAWFNDGRIVYRGTIGVQAGLFIFGSEQAPTPLTNFFQDTAPDPAPDGSKVAFVSDREDTWDLYVVDVLTQEVTRLTNDPALDTAPTWSPDGTRIAFVSDREGRWAIWTVLPDGTDRQLLLELPGNFYGDVTDIPPGQQTTWQTERISWVK